MRTKQHKPFVGASVASALLLLGALGGCENNATSESLTVDAKRFVAEGDTKAAVIQLKNALVKNPSDVEARLTLGNLYNKMGDPQSAEKELRKAASLGAPPDKTMAGIATALIAQNEFKKLLDETAQATAGAGPDLLSLRGDAHLALGQHEDAAAAYKSALVAQPEHPKAVIGLARLSIVKNDVEEAAAAAARLVASNPNNAEAWTFHGSILRGQGKKEEALAAFDKALALDAGQRSARLEKAFLQIEMRRFDAARKELAVAGAAMPGNLMVTYANALLAFSEGKHAAARELLQKILKVAPSHMPSLLLAGATELNLGASKQAELYLQQYVASNPRNDHGRKLLVGALLKLGRTEEALAVLEPALKDKDPDQQFLGLAGEAYIQARDFDNATKYFEMASAKAPKTADFRTSLAMAKLGKGDAADAVQELELSTKLDPSSRKAAFLLATTELRLKHYDKALAAVETLEAKTPNDPMVHNLKGGIYLYQFDMPKAKASLEKALALEPTYFPAASNLARMYMHQKNPAAAKKQLLSFLEKDKDNVEAMTLLAQFAALDGKEAEIAPWLERAHAVKPDAVQPTMRLADYYLKSGQKDKALTVTRKFLAIDPTNLQMLDLMGASQLANGDSSGAIDTYSKLASSLPKSALPRLRLAAAYLAMKNEKAAVENLNQAISIDPTSVDAHIMRADLLTRKGLWDEAMKSSTMLQKKHPRNPVGFLLEGEVLAAQGKTGPALQRYEQALAIQASTPIMLKVHAASVRAGKAKEADVRLAKWEAERPGDVELLRYSAERELANKQFPAAIRKLETIVTKQPNDAAALNNLAWAYQQVKDARALKTAEQAHALAGNSPAVLDTLGWILAERGDSRKAVPLLRKASSLAPAASSIKFHLASALNRSGDKVAAKKELETLLASGKDFPESKEAQSMLAAM